MYKNRIPDSYQVQEGVSLANILGTPVYIDTTDDNNIYLGYSKISPNLDKETELLIVKTNINGNIITKFFAYGEWDNRTELQYK